MKTLACSVCLLAFVTLTARANEAKNSPAWAGKIDPRVLQFAAESASGETDFLVLLTEQADLSGAAKLTTKLEKGTYVFQKLTEVAWRSQSAVLRSLDQQGIAHQSFWIANMIRVRGKTALIQQMAQRADVAHIYANPLVHLEEPMSDPSASPNATDAIEPGVSWIHAPNVWTLGFTGQGIVVAGNDTGYRWTHAALKGQYRGWNGTVADHNYNWHDSIHSGGGVCGADSPQPCDDDGHGTHTMGTMVGTDGGTNQVGVAPGAKWIGCRNMDQGNGTPATYSECFQFFIAPTDSTGNNPDPSKAPDVLNNSWGCPTSEGCGPLTLQIPLENVRAAGIAVIVSAGNAGSACSTVEDPPAIYEAAISVGASANNSNAIASFSSRGPVTADGSNRQKPNVTAPGISIRSSYGSADTAYASLSGTSMSGPHTVGTVALILSAHPELRGNVDAIQTLLEQSAVHLTTSQICGGIPGTTIPNNTFGWGRIDALGAVTFGQATPTPTPGGDATPTPTPGGSVTPTPAPPTPTPGSGPAQAVNLSTRLRVETGTDNAGIGGFIITGSVPKEVLLRALGPSLGVDNSLADPTLALHGPSGFTTIVNDNWKVRASDGTSQQAEIEATGIAPTNDLESAIHAMLDPGAYTAILTGNGTPGTGVALVEVYDLATGVASKLGDISTRAFVNTGNDVVIAGFILGSSTGNDTVVIRGLGPSLADSGLSPVLADPTLDLFDISGTIIQSNDNWGGPQLPPPGLPPGLPPSNPLESMIVANLPPGSYTARLSGVNGGTGLGLVEVYDNIVVGPTATPGTPTPTPPAGATPTPTPTPPPGGSCVENFDGVTAPALPPGWTTGGDGDGTLWVTSTAMPDTAPNAAFVTDQDGISEKVLDRTGITITSAAAQISFRNNFDTEFSDGTFWDGGVLEVSSPNINAGVFTDVTDPAVGGSFVSGGYTGIISNLASNPLADRMAWSGTSGGYINTVINLGPNLNGQTITLQFRMGTDEAVSAPGWFVDTFSITGASCPQ